MKKTALLCILFIFTALTACNSSISSPETTSFETRFSSEGNNRIFSDGSGAYFITLSGFLHYFDYTSEQSVLVCNKPNCLHRETTETMPVEMACEAYTGGYSYAFVVDSYLYTVEDNSYNQVYQLIRSDIDRSNQSVLLETAEFFSNFYVHNNMLFYQLINYEIAELDSDTPSQTGSQTVTLHAYNISEDTDEILLSLNSSFYSNIQIIGTDEEYIYLQYMFFEEKLTFENALDMDMVIEYHALSIDSLSITPVFESLWNMDCIFICKEGDTVYLSYSENRNDAKANIYAYDMIADELTIIAEDIYYDTFADRKIIYYTMEDGHIGKASFETAERDGYYFDLDTLSIHLFPYTYSYWIYGETDDYFLMTHTENNSLIWQYMKKENYFNGSYEYIPMLDQQ